MTPRRYAVALLVLFAACKQVNQEAPAQTLVFATFDSVNGIIPTPNDLALQQTPLLPSSAQKELLQAFVTAGGFPWDQEVSISIPFRAVTFDAATNTYATAASPAINPATATTSTVALLQLAGGVATPVTFTAEVDAAKPGLLTIRRAADPTTGSRRWTPGARYVLAVRGGTNGVKTASGLPVNADQAIALVLPNKDMTLPENQPPGGLDAATAGALNSLRSALWNPLNWSTVSGFWTPGVDTSILPAFTAVDTVFPHAEVAAIATFEIAPQDGTVVLVDPGSGVAPLPFDLLRSPVPADTTAPLDAGLILPNPAFGAAGAGLVTLDGFSTTAMLLASTSGPVLASSVAANVKLYKRNGNGTWSLVTAYVPQPPQIVQGGGSVAIGLQPAVFTGTVALPPLAENTKYAVIIGNAVQPAAGGTLVRSTVAKLLLAGTQPTVTPWPVLQGTDPTTFVSLLAGIDPLTAAGLQKMREELTELFTDQAIDKTTLAMAYTFKTQTVTPTSVSLSAAPYSFETGAGAAIITPGTVTPVPPDTMGAAAGFPPGSFPNVQSFYTTTIEAPNGTDLVSGTLALPQSIWMNQGVRSTLQVLVAAPTVANTTGGLAPLVVFHHGITRTSLDMLAIANTLAGKGFVVAAIDAPYHGSRSFCKQDADCVGGGAGSCTPIVAGGSLASIPGICAAGTLDPNVASGNYFVSGNFFRTRDAIRQDLMDQSSLVLALARPPPGVPWPQPTSDDLTTALAAIGYAIDPTRVYFVGQSLGGIVGAEMLATNPRFGRGVLNVAGGTLTDIFTNAPDFTAQVNALFLSLGIDRSQIATNPAVAAAYLKTVNVAKWILDPADPINFAAYVETGLASPIDALATGLGVTSTEAFGMAAFGDTTIPNAYNFELYGLATGIDQATYVGAGSVDGALVNVSHGFLLQGSSVAATLAAQADAANFLATLALPADALAATPGTQVILP